jgi:hypothetical protein
MRRLLRTGGRIALTAWGTAEKAPFAGIVARALGKQTPALRDELLLPFALADPLELLRLLQSAGFRGVEIQRQTRPAHFDSAADFFAPYEEGGGRLGQAFLRLPPEGGNAVRREVTAELGAFAKGDRLEMDVEAYVASGIAA